jgi:recombination protein RecR
MQYTKELADLIEEFQKFPTIGPKSAQRMAFTLLKRSSDQVEKFLRVVKEAKENIHYCDKCFNLTSNDICEICNDYRRDQRQICVVESVKDLVALERTCEYRGLYHVLGGVISPLDGIGADDLNISPLLVRVRDLLRVSQEDSIEIILAIGLSTEGEATMLYLRRVLEQILKEQGLNTNYLRVSRLAHGLPVGADLDYADELTLAKAIEARVLCA